MFKSFKVSEKKAISEPASKKDNKKRITTKKIRIVVAAVVIARRLKFKRPRPE
jgi:hypothetical protein